MTLPRRIIALASMLVMVLALCAGPAHAASKKVLIKSVKEVGTLVILMDGSQWRIDNPEDQELVYDWLPFQTVVVKDNKVLVNIYRGDIVDARMTEKPVKKVVASSTPMYKPGSVGAGSAPAASAAGGQVVVPEDLVKRLDKILKRLEDLEFSLKSVEMRLLRLERMAGVGP
ncbi:MAG: hypothetical protein K9K66_07250 [Desulfarculaceae bacterium]|nr:hypothetical protein [Desulfarculaceae bacterium]MCF8071888.1 hypothetical protein [Desulfarculaceae bacterium]MCF8101438.1 hypothetical protein [Desulfarculaceae bacterium]MCF8114955.1 hypothetical protein [Desulfarculaceae bacterium]